MPEYLSFLTGIMCEWIEGGSSLTKWTPRSARVFTRMYILYNMYDDVSRSRQLKEAYFIKSRI